MFHSSSLNPLNSEQNCWNCISYWDVLWITLDEKKAKRFICYRFIPWIFCLFSTRIYKTNAIQYYHHATDFVHSIGNDGMKLKRCEIIKILAQNECESIYPPLILTASCFCAEFVFVVLCYSLFFVIFILALLFNRIFFQSCFPLLIFLLCFAVVVWCMKPFQNI